MHPAAYLKTLYLFTQKSAEDYRTEPGPMHGLKLQSLQACASNPPRACNLNRVQSEASQNKMYLQMVNIIHRSEIIIMVMMQMWRS